MTQPENEKVKKKEKRSKADLYKLSNPHKYEDSEGDYWATQEPFEVENHRPRKNHVGRGK